MKKLLIALLALAFLFTGCAGLVSPQETPLPTETPTGEATEAPTALPEAPYKDPRSKYAYITAEGRDR
ncbi:MAG: hypothetical protein IK064_04075, partial [Clostridia bacterium]|nr:hypothetical protein [Clostridia bacterium]